MNSLFHRAKHWQLFTILFGGIILFQVFGMIYMSTTMSQDVLMNRPPKMSNFFAFFIPMMLLSITMIFGWQWSIGAGLRHKLPQGVTMNFKLFRAFTIVPIVYFVLYMIFMFSFISKMEQLATTGDIFQVFQMVFSMFLGMIILLPLGLFATFCMFYSFYYCAKTLKSIELGREAELGDYIGYFFLFWFNFVGFWIIQPSVNQITSEDWIPPAPPPGYEPLIDPDPGFPPIPIKEEVPRGELLKTKNHDAFDHDDDFDGLF